MKFQQHQEVAKKYGVGTSDWMNLEVGLNKLRIVSEFEDFGTHFQKAIKKSTICIGKENCILCQEGDKSKVQFLGWVIDRKDGNLKLLRIGYQIFKQLGLLGQSDQYKFDAIPTYDITITRTGTGLETEYTIMPDRQDTLLTEDEKEHIASLKSSIQIIENMKAKVNLNLGYDQKLEPVIDEDEEINVADIPF